ncbi:MAG: hypothetical protein ORN55_06205 [Chitinophagaceae bacterium]|jgi:hypothetical protein|nr:hypothetical protein [Chitinophagaceae bacterium]
MKNNIFTGIFLSLLVTVFGAALVYVLKYSPNNMTVPEFIDDVIHSNAKKSAVLSLALLANIPLIYFNQMRKRLKTITGIAIVIGIMCLIIINARFNIF